MYEQHLKSDIAITFGDYTFNCHTCILATRSQFFEVMLRSGMSESKTGKIDLSQSEHSFNKETLEALLLYLYTDVFNHIQELDLALSLYTNLQYFGISDSQHTYFVIYLREVIEEGIKVENCLDILQVIDIHNSLPCAIGDFLLEFIVKNYVEISSLHFWELAHLPSHLFQAINIKLNLTFIKSITVDKK